MKMVDPPGGWRYGFPKAMPDDIENVREWCIENGYPRDEAIQLGDHMWIRMWDCDDEASV